ILWDQKSYSEPYHICHGLQSSFPISVLFGPNRSYPVEKIPKFFLRGLEEGGYRTIFKDLMNRTCQQRRDRQHGEVVPALGGLRQGVGGDNFLSTALGQTLACWVGEYAVGTCDNDGTCASFA